MVVPGQGYHPSVNDIDLSTITPSGPWPLAKRVAFRFAFLYFLFYALTNSLPLTIVPIVGGLGMQGLGKMFQELGLLTGHHLVGIEGEIFRGPTGSGDTTLDYLMTLNIALFATAGTLLWSVLSRGARSHDKLARWLVLGTRYYVGICMMIYGLAKVMKGQFPEPSLATLLATYGESSPMRLAWTFMGYSAPYTIFTGLGELVGGLLLMFRWTRTLGAAITAGVMANVAMINFSYDVPVKLFSSHLFVFAAAILVVDAPRLWNLFVRNRPVGTADLSPPISSRRVATTLHVIKGILLAIFLGQGLYGQYRSYYQWGDGRPKSEMYGIHDVRTFYVDDEERPPLATDTYRWKAVVIDRPEGYFGRPGYIAIQHMDGSIQNHQVHLDVAEGTLTFPGSSPPAEMEIEKQAQGRWILYGPWQGNQLEVHFTPRPLSKMELPGRGFHWINEVPHQRP